MVVDPESSTLSKKPRKSVRTATWKSIERSLASLLGGERIPVTGRTIGSAPDIRHSSFGIEVKHGKQVPKLIQKAMLQALMATRAGQRPLVVMHPLGSRIDESLVILRIKDFIDICPIAVDGIQDE